MPINLLFRVLCFVEQLQQATVLALDVQVVCEEALKDWLLLNLNWIVVHQLFGLGHDGFVDMLSYGKIQLSTKKNFYLHFWRSTEPG